MRERGRKYVKSSSLAIALGVMAGQWILFVAGVRRNEMIVGIVSVIIAAAFLRTILQSEQIELNFEWRDVRVVWRVPWYIVTNTYTLCEVLAKDLLMKESAGSYYRVSGFRTSKTEPTLVARRVLATTYTSISPNSIVIGIDYEQSRLLLHQVKRDEVSMMTKLLGGQP